MINVYYKNGYLYIRKNKYPPQKGGLIWNDDKTLVSIRVGGEKVILPVTKFEELLDENNTPYLNQESFEERIKYFFTSDPVYPLRVGLNEIYESDIDWDNSNFSGWVGDPRDIFRNANHPKGIYNDLSDEVKCFTLRLFRPRVGRSFGIGTSVGNFSNVEATFLGSGDTERGFLQMKNDPHKHTSLIYSLEEFIFNAIRVCFYTSDRVDVSNVFINYTYSSRKQDYILKFGLNPEIDINQKETIWSIGDQYIFTTTPQDYYISSSSALDNTTVDGEVIVLNSEGRYQREYYTVQLNGQTPVKIPTTGGLLCVASNRAFNNSDTPYLGEIYIYEDTPTINGVPTDLSKVRSHIRIDKGQTEQAVYTVPEFLEDGRQVLLAEIYRWGGELINKQVAAGVLSMYIAPKGKASRIQSNLGLSGDLAAKYEFGENTPLEVDGGTDVYVNVDKLTANDISIQASFVIKLITS